MNKNNMNEIKKEKAKKLRYKKSALETLRFEQIQYELQEICEECSDIHYFFDEDDSTILNAMDGDSEEEFEFKMMFADLYGKSEQLSDEIRSNYVTEYFDDFFVGIVGHRLFKKPTGKGKFKIRKNSAITFKKETPENKKHSKIWNRSDIKRKIKKKTAYRNIKPDALKNSPADTELPNIDKDKPSTSAEAKIEPTSVKKPGDKNTAETKITETTAIPKTENKPDSALQAEKPGKLRFTQNETSPPKITNKKFVKTERQANRANAKLDKARNKLPARRKLRSGRVFDAETGKAKRRLYFEKEIKPQSEHIKGALPLRPVKAAGNSAIVFGHRKLYQVENDNVGVKAAHHAEMVAEGGVRSAFRYHKTAPYRKVAKLEKQAQNQTVKLTYQKTLAENPKLQSNVFSRMRQKRKIKKDYAKKAREAKKAAERAKKAGSVTGSTAKAVAGVVKRHPVATTILILIVLLVFMLMSFCSLGGGMGSSGLGGVLAASYLAEDEDIDNAEIV